MKVCDKHHPLPVLLLLIVGCASPGMAKKDYDEKVSRVRLGMSRDEYLSIFPEAEQRGMKKYENGSVEALEVRWRYYAFFPTGNPYRNEWTGNEGKPVWFYFYNGELIQYGDPNGWPADPEKAANR